jgi:hypothetical protein
MAELIQEYSTEITSGDGTAYVTRVYGDERADGMWVGWLEFQPAAGGGPTLQTEQETSQSDRASLEYWASGLEPTYFEGALARARRRVS